MRLATSVRTFFQFDKTNFELDSRSDDKIVVLPHRGGATQKIAKIFLPFGNLDFNQFHRCSSSTCLKHSFLLAS